jgi:tRNA(Ile)-lysidine synthase
LFALAGASVPEVMAAESDNLMSEMAASWPLVEWRDVHLVVAVSGGADSVALLRAMCAAKQEAGGAGRLYVGHFDHGLRMESSADAAWVATLCAQLQVPCETGRSDVQAAAVQQGDGLEAASRAARYEFLARAAENLGARFVATAHTADDQVETVLHRLVRGTGIGGLAGIPRTRPLTPGVTLVRPLLGVGRQQVIAYLQRIGQSYRVDATNADPRFTRNRLRHELLPLLRKEFNSDVDAALMRLATQAAGAQQLILQQAQRIYQYATVVLPGRVELDAEKLANEPPLLIRETCKLAWSAAGLPLQAMGYDQWQQLEALIADANAATLNLPGGVRAQRLGSRATISRSA